MLHQIKIGTRNTMQEFNAILAVNPLLFTTLGNVTPCHSKNILVSLISEILGLPPKLYSNLGSISKFIFSD